MRCKLLCPNKPLRASILSDLKHPITQHLIKIYTKESFVYRELNKTTRRKIEENIEYFGPYAAAFGQIINAFPKSYKFPQDGMVLFRGTSVPH